MEGNTMVIEAKFPFHDSILDTSRFCVGILCSLGTLRGFSYRQLALALLSHHHNDNRYGDGYGYGYCNDDDDDDDDDRCSYHSSCCG
eukprot:CAMPEP_0116547626 /NCGR_PEP_ID=MMETSP0397-20121206/3880_1 /TAXON_ID=216820 /ORGANISM="Cyclophora tenuis, Strain ECT3854" /LENGTH=86 /DNA_ID=CAMNT_0004072175 /DNA_START=196 /DNA_END=452 /DNA_ORIENTATION=-